MVSTVWTKVVVEALVVAGLAVGVQEAANETAAEAAAAAATETAAGAGTAAEDASDTGSVAGDASSAPVDEATAYPLHTVPIPEGIVLEVGGLLPRPDGSLLVSTRRGDVWHVADPLGDAPVFTRWADGLQEPLGLLADGDAVLVMQRGELSRLRDADGDLHADVYETVEDRWTLSGSYHEYAFGPTRAPDGSLWFTLNIPFGPRPFGTVDWRGWAMRLTPEGELQPVCGGLRSPAGVATAPWGDVFATDNQGEWCGASKLTHLRPGAFLGHPLGIGSAERPESLVEPPGELPDGVLMPLAARRVPGFTLPAVWFPYDVTGRSPSGMAWDTTGGAFGPFDGQLFVGDQFGANVLRVFLEQVEGVWQGACFRFREGLRSGVTRVAFDDAGGLWVGGSDRGWPSLGPERWGLERLTWSGEVPFEILSMEAYDEGFRLTFTRPVDPATAGGPEHWSGRRFTYRLHGDYGSPETDDWPVEVLDAAVAPDARSVLLRLSGLREGYVHELVAEGVRSSDGEPLLHAQAWYTMLERPRVHGFVAPLRVVVVTDDAHLEAGARLAATLPVEADRGLQPAPVAPGVRARAVDLADPGPLPDLLREASLTVLALDRAAPDGDTRALLDRALDSGRSLAVLSPSLQLFADDDATDDGQDGVAGDDLLPELLGVTSVEASGSTLAADADVPVVPGRAGLPRPVLAGHCTVLAAAELPDGAHVPALWVHEARGRRVVVSSTPEAVALSGSDLAALAAEETAVARRFHAAVRWALDLGSTPTGVDGD